MLRDDRLLPITWILLAPPAALALLFGVALFLFPDRTGTLFAWTITPRMSAVFVGASFTFGGLATFRLLWNGRWHPLGATLPGTWAFSTALLAATLLHWDRFHHGTLRFYIWLVIYVALPLGLPLAYWLNQRRDPGPAAVDVALVRRVRVGLALTGAVYAVMGLALFLRPAAFIPVWPWQLTPLMARVIGAWLILPGVAAIATYREKRYTAIRSLVRDLMLWEVLLLAGTFFERDNFDFARLSAWLWVALLGSTLVLTGAFYRSYERVSQNYVPVIPTEGEVGDS